MNKNLRLSASELMRSKGVDQSMVVASTESIIIEKWGVVRVYDPLTAQDMELLRKVSPIKWVDFHNHEDLTSETYCFIDSLFAKEPNARVWLVLNGNGPKNINFLQFLPNLKNLTLDSFDRNEIETLNRYLDLTQLFISGKNLSLKGLEKQEKIKTLTISEKLKDLEVIANLHHLEKLTVDRLTLKTTKFFHSLPKLKELHFKLGSAIDLDFLRDMKGLEHLSFTYVRNLEELALAPINDIPALKTLKFDYQPRIYNLDWLKKTDVSVEIGYCKNFERK